MRKRIFATLSTLLLALSICVISVTDVRASEDKVIKVDGSYLTTLDTSTGNTDGSIVLWDLESGKDLLMLKGHRGLVNSLTLTKDCNFAISAAIDNSVRIWDINAGSQIHLLPEDIWQVNSYEFTPNHHSVVTAGEDGQLKVWEFSYPC